jgi:hypothetical protein
MRLSNERIQALQKILKEVYGLDYNEEQTQQEGLAIMRFWLVKTQRQQQLIKEFDDGQLSGNSRFTA